MKKAKTKTKTAAATKPAKKKTRKSKTIDLVEVRKDITNIVGTGAAEMTKAMVDEALKGELGPVKYLFEVAGLYPVAGDAAAVKPEEDSLARTLLRRLGLPEEPVIGPEDERVRFTLPAAKSAEEDSDEEETSRRKSAASSEVDSDNRENDEVAVSGSANPVE